MQFTNDWKAWEDVRHHVLSYIDGATTAVADQYMRQSADEFCMLSKWLRADFTMPITANVGLYQIDLSTITPGYPTPQIIDVHEVNINGTPSRPIQAYESWQAAQATMMFDTMSGYAGCYQVLPGGYIRIAPPVDDGSMRVLVSINGATEEAVVAALIDKWGDYIGAGARARLHAQHAKVYTDRSAASRLRAYFHTGVSQAVAEVNSGYTTVPMRAAGTRWF